MKICHTQVMKMIKEYEEQKRVLVRNEDENSRVSYKEGETKLTNGYDYNAVRGAVRALDQEVLKLRSALAKANCTVIIPEYGLTIGEALVRLAQLQVEKGQIEDLAMNVQLTRRLTPNGIIEFTECLYDVEKAKKDVSDLRLEIGKLQMAIDRANLNNYIEV